MSESPYGYCPVCGAPASLRERRWDGNDQCENGHEYPSRSAVQALVSFASERAQIRILANWADSHNLHSVRDLLRKAEHEISEYENVRNANASR